MCLTYPNIPYDPTDPLAMHHIEKVSIPQLTPSRFSSQARANQPSHMSAPSRFGPLDGGHSSRGGKRTTSVKTRLTFLLDRSGPIRQHTCGSPAFKACHSSSVSVSLKKQSAGSFLFCQYNPQFYNLPPSILIASAVNLVQLM
jgi:hypothetical protein